MAIMATVATMAIMANLARTVCYTLEMFFELE